MSQELQPQLYPKGLEYLGLPSPDVPCTLFRGVFEQAAQTEIVIPDDLPHSLRHLAPHLEQLQAIGRFGGYPDAFKLNEKGQPFETTLDHTKRCVATGRIIAENIKSHLNTIPNPQLRYYLQISIGMGATELADFHWLHDLDEIENLLGPIDYEEYVRWKIAQAEAVGLLNFYELGGTQGEQSWDYVQAVEGIRPDQAARFREKHLQEILRQIEHGHFYKITRIDPFHRAGDWLKYGGPFLLRPASSSILTTTTAILAKIIDLADGNTLFHKRLSEYLAGGGDINLIPEMPLDYTFKRTTQILINIFMNPGDPLHPIEYTRKVWIAVLYEQIRYIYEIWQASNQVPDRIASNLAMMEAIFAPLISQNPMEIGNIILRPPSAQ